MDPKILRQQMEAHVIEAKRLGADYKGREHEMPQSVQDSIAAELGKADEAKAKLQLAQRTADADAFLHEPAAGSVTHGDWRPAAQGEGDEKVDPQSWRSFDIATPFGTKSFRYFVPERVQRNSTGKADEGKAYTSAFESYLRKGDIRSLGPNDYKTLSEGIDNAGGFLVPPDYQNEILRKIATMAVIRQLARVASTGRDIVQWPRVNYTTDNKYTSGARLTWTGETPASATTHRVTDPVFGMFSIPVHTAMASMPLTSDLVEDQAFDIIGVSQQLLAEAFALGEDNIFLNGTGNGQPMGILGELDGNGPTTVKSGTNGAITTTADAHGGKRINDVYYAVPAQYRRNQSSAWVMNSGALQACDDLVDGNKRPLLQTLNQATMGNAEPQVLKNRPIYVDEFMPDLGAASKSIMFGDWTGYAVFDRVGFAIQRLTELYAETNVQLLLARKRVAAYCVEPYRFRVMNCAP